MAVAYLKPSRREKPRATRRKRSPVREGDGRGFPRPRRRRKPRSRSETVADYINANGGDWEIIAQWAAAQEEPAEPASNAASDWLIARLHGISRSRRSSDRVNRQSDPRNVGEKYGRTWEMACRGSGSPRRVKFEGKRSDRRLVRIMRTEQSKPHPFEKGQRAVPAPGQRERVRFALVFWRRTLTAVPHTGITGLYFFDRIPGQGNEFFLGDSENELRTSAPASTP